MINTKTVLLVGAMFVLSWAAASADSAKPADSDKAPLAHAKFWDEMDTNHDGVITHDEWVAHGEKRFKEIDTNGDGKIDKAEQEASDKKWLDKHREMMKTRRAAMKDKAAADKAPDAKK